MLSEVESKNSYFSTKDCASKRMHKGSLSRVVLDESQFVIASFCETNLSALKVFCSVLFSSSQYSKAFFKGSLEHPQFTKLGVLCCEIKKESELMVYYLNACLNEEIDTIDDDKCKDLTLYITSLGVLPSYRRLGIASRLIDSLFSTLCDAKEQFNVSKVALHVKNSNSAAASFYEKHGFKCVGEDPMFYGRFTEKDPQSNSKALFYEKKLD